MSKRHPILPVLGALGLLLCAPATAAAIGAEDEVTIKLGFDARQISDAKYEVLAGGVVLMNVTCEKRSLLWVFAAPDANGLPDYSAVLTLFLDQSPGTLNAFVEIPAELAGATFHLRALAQSFDGTERHLSDDIVIRVVEQIS